MLYGNWVTSNENMPIKEYGLHHLVELQKYSTITNCLSFDDLVEKLASFDKELPISSDIENFILREIGPNRGTAGLQLRNALSCCWKKSDTYFYCISWKCLSV